MQRVANVCDSDDEDDANTRFNYWLSLLETKRSLRLTFGFHVLGFAAHTAMCVVTTAWARMNIYVDLTEQRLAWNNSTRLWQLSHQPSFRWWPSWIIFYFFLLSAVFHLVEGFSLLLWLVGCSNWLAQWYARALYNCVVASRWIEYTLSAALQVANLAVLAQIKDSATVLCLFSLMSTTMFFGLLQEVYSSTLIEDNGGGQRVWKPHTFGSRLLFWALGWVPYSVCWVVLIAQILRNLSDARPDEWFLPVLVGSQVVSFSGFALTQLYNIFSSTGPTWYASGELSYVILSFTAKALFGVLAIQQSLGPDGKYDDVSGFSFLS